MIPYIRLFLLELFWHDWQYVGVFEEKLKADYHDWIVFLHCYESRWGRRKIKIIVRYNRVSEVVMGGWNIRKFIRMGSFYQTELLPWLEGRDHNKIPSYKKIESGKWDFLKKLKGETPVMLNDDEK